MSILASLVRAYDRLLGNGELPPFGYASQGIHACIVLDRTGAQVGAPTAFELDQRGRPIARQLDVPYFGGRSGTNAPPYFLWDNSAYVLGVTGKPNFNARQRFNAFREFHLSGLMSETDLGLVAVREFLSHWDPENSELTPELFDRNIVFRLLDRHEFVHDSDAAKAAWGRLYEPDTIGKKVCLISGEPENIARIHPPIGSFENPARIVSFDKGSDAFASYGHVQAENAPTGITSAFAYTAALNKFLKRDSSHRIQIGEASTVFWADASDAALAGEAESIFAQLMEPSDKEAAIAKDVAHKLEQIRAGKPLREIEPKLDGVRFFVLGLAPNSARISIRFYHEDRFGALTRNYQQFLQEMELEPAPREPNPPLWRYLIELAVLGKRENIPPNLAGEWMRAILSGTRYPMTLLPTVLLRIRSDGEIGPLRVAMLRALLVRNFNLSKEAPVALDPENINRLFARSIVCRLRALPNRRPGRRQRLDQGQILRLGSRAAEKGISHAGQRLCPPPVEAWQATPGI
jgi:CRISPR-associated protein Csd1